jgi:DNA polymerase III sliding clamp (beta) subunit (PCNA family)
MADALLRKSAKLQANENWVKVSHESGWYSCKQIDGKYPNYRQVIPAKKTKLGEVGVPEFKELVGRTLGFNEAKECKGIFTFSKDGIEIDFIGQNNSKLRHQFPGKFEPFKVGINTRALFNSLSHVKEQKITIYSDSVSGNLGPITIQAGDLMILTMPMRLS